MDDNLFLRHLGASDRQWLQAHMQRRAFARNDVAAEQHTRISGVILPIDCILSVITVMSDGRAVESRTVGRESGFGLLHALGSRYSHERVIFQVGGEAWTLPIASLSELASRSPIALNTIARFSQATIIQSTVSLACNSLHPVESRLCRWLLLTQDRLCSDVLPLTQEHLAIMLAVQRTTVTAAASELQARRAIRYSRGKITVLDREKLIAGACECFEQIEEGVQRLIGESVRSDADGVCAGEDRAPPRA